MDFVKEIIDAWDPIGLFPGAPDNEYWTEINSISYLVNSTDDLVKLSEGIYAVFIREFDDAFKKSIADCELIAQMLLSQKRTRKI